MVGIDSRVKSIPITHGDYFFEIFSSSPDDIFLKWSKLKAFADDKINVTEKLKFALGRVENIM